ncbi:hypothetical protein F5Y01DRAFT_323261 [Xylaria sp. FL0043]|nr:hypothetical protein F5Y01DRAFT_323261 [Xylaria sp. FL0043]
MAVSDRYEESADKIGIKHTIQHHNHQTKGNRAISFLPHVAARPFRVFRQLWKYCQTGRNIRKQRTQGQGSKTGDDRPEKAEDKPQQLQNCSEVSAPAIKRFSPSRYYSEDQPASNAQHRPVIEHWVHQGGEWPWRIEQIVHRDSSDNARGIWVLEVKDLSAMHWETKDRPGRRIPATVPQAQWPFPCQWEKEDRVNSPVMKERDELMEWLWQR